VVKSNNNNNNDDNNNVLIVWQFAITVTPTVIVLLAQVDTEPTKRYKGVHWGKMRGQRTNFAGKEGPGPGEYDPQSDCKCRGEPIEEDGERVQFESFIPRFTDQLVIEEAREVSTAAAAAAVSNDNNNKSYSLT